MKPNNLVILILPYYGGITAGYFLLFLDYFENDKISPSLTALYGFYLGAHTLNILYNIIQNTTTSLLETIPLAGNTPHSGIPTFFVLIFMVLIIQKLYGIYRQSIDNEQKNLIRWLIVTVIFYLINPAWMVGFAYQLNNSQPEFKVFMRHIAPQISIILGNIVFFYSYVRTKVGLLQLQIMERLFVIETSGILLFTHDFLLQRSQIYSSNLILLSGGITAITTVLKEAVGETSIKSIQFQEKQIMVSHHLGFSVFLLVNRPTMFLLQAIEKFGKMFEMQYHFGSDRDEIVFSKKYKDANILVLNAFGLTK
ncbi:MAG: hypothetical protein ACXAC7_16025 [Candidatus Hodarchaeales archaeon]